MVEDTAQLDPDHYNQKVEQEAFTLLINHAIEHGNEIAEDVYTIPPEVTDQDTIIEYELATPRNYPFSVREHSDATPDAYAYKKAKNQPEYGYRILAIHQYASDVADRIEDMVEGELNAVDYDHDHGLIFDHTQMEPAEIGRRYTTT